MLPNFSESDNVRHCIMDQAYLTMWNVSDRGQHGLPAKKLTLTFVPHMSYEGLPQKQGLKLRFYCVGQKFRTFNIMSFL